MRFARMWAGVLLNVALAPVAASALADNTSSADRVATAPAAAARSSAEPEAEPPAPITTVGPGPAFEPETPAAQPPPSPPASQPRRFQRWTPEEIARVRAALLRQRKQMLTEVRPVGDARAHFTLGFEVNAVSRPDSGFEHFQLGKVSPRFGIFATYDLVPIREQLTLFVELGAGYENDESDDLLGLGTSAELSSQTLHAGLGVRWDPLTWLSPQLRAWGGASLFQLDVSGTNEAFDTGYATSVFGALGAGFILHTPPRTFESSSGSLAALQLGLLVEVGYALRSAIDFRLRTQPDPRRIEVIDASLGSLSLSGAYLRFAAVVRF